VPVVATPGLGRPGESDRLAAIGFDVMVVACFPRRIPATLVAAAPAGAVNVHPSLLPHGRGPDPVFWTVRRGERTTGVTLHLIEATFDTGPILARWEIPTQAGTHVHVLERHLFGLGAALLPDTLADLLAGRATPEPQDEALATWAPIPGPADFVVPTTLPARWAYDFVRAVRGTGPTTVLVGASGATLPVTDAIALGPADRATEPVRRQGERVVVRFLDGTVTFSLAAGVD